MSRKLFCSRGLFDVESLLSELEKIEKQLLDPLLWNDKEKAQNLLKQKAVLAEITSNFLSLEKDFEAFKEYLALIKHDNISDSEKRELDKEIESLHKKSQKLEVECLFAGEADSSGCFLEINAGAGGTESHDWAEMLLRMYTRFVNIKDFTSEIVDELAGEEAGIKSVTLKITGHNAYGWLKTESGVHRLVRISPFNAAGKRQTSFASVWVYPIVDDNINIQIVESDLRIDTYRSSGAGGQHVNTTDSAVRITHIPTNIVVQCQSDRSQHRNKDEALRMLKSRLYERELRIREEALQEQNAGKASNSWGNQIRSYVLHPYKLVKDHRTDFELSDAEGVLDGNLEKIILASLSHKVSKSGK